MATDCYAKGGSITVFSLTYIKRSKILEYVECPSVIPMGMIVTILMRVRVGRERGHHHHVGPSVFIFVCITGRIFVKFYVEDCYEYLSRKFKFR